MGRDSAEDWGGRNQCGAEFAFRFPKAAAGHNVGESPTRPFPESSLSRLLKAVFEPKAGQRIGILIDLADPKQIAGLAFLMDAALAIQRHAHGVSHQGLKNGVMAELGLRGGEMFAYRVTGGSNLDLRDAAWPPKGRQFSLTKDVYPHFDTRGARSQSTATAPGRLARLGDAARAGVTRACRPARRCLAADPARRGIPENLPVERIVILPPEGRAQQIRRHAPQLRRVAFGLNDEIWMTWLTSHTRSVAGAPARRQRDCDERAHRQRLLSRGWHDVILTAKQPPAVVDSEGYGSTRSALQRPRLRVWLA
jgi:hypothetical protein